MRQHWDRPLAIVRERTRVGTFAMFFGVLGILLSLGEGVSFGGVKAVSRYYHALGSAGDTLVTNDGDVLVSLTRMGPDQQAGIQVFTSVRGTYRNPCGRRTIIDLPSFRGQAVASVHGMKLLPRPSRHGARSGVVAAIEEQGVEFFRLASLRTCAIDGTINVQQPPKRVQSGAPGTFAVAVTPGKPPRYAFVANEYGLVRGVDFGGTGTVGVIAVRRDSSGRFLRTTRPVQPKRYIYVTGGFAMPDVTVSHDGKLLYVVSEAAADGSCTRGGRRFQCRNPTRSRNGRLVSDGCVNQYPGTRTANNGLLTIIDVDKATRGRGQRSIIRTVASGCSPVRVVETADGRTIWVATRGGSPGSGGRRGRVLAFDVSRLTSRSRNVVNRALLGVGYTGGTQPVGLALFDHDRYLAVANSNRFTDGTHGKTNVAILSVADPSAVAVKAVCRSDERFSFPRGVSLGPDGSTLFVANFGCTPGPGTQCVSAVAGRLQVITTTVGPGPASSCAQ